MYKNITKFLFNNPEEIGLDNYLVQVISFMTTVIGFLGTLISIVLKLGMVNIASTLLTTLAFGGIFLLCRIKGKFVISKYVLILLSIVVINIQWVVNFGTNGPILYLFVVIQSFIVILFNKWARIFLTIIILLNVTVLFAIELHNPGIFGTYSNNITRLTDLYWGMLIYLALCISLISIAIRFYMNQNEKAQLADKLKSSFLANMSHEIRTPMNAIIGFGHLLSETKITEEQKEYLNVINENSYHLLKLIDDIIDISKIEANQVNISEEVFSLNDLFEAINNVIQPYIESHNRQNLRFISNKPPGYLTIQSDFTRLKQVLTNLLSNAIKFTEKGSIEYGCSVNQNSITFYVQDTGMGIEKKYLPEIFKRFGKIENIESEKIFGGTGIGLSISKQLVELMKGKIWVESEPGKGSKFIFTIPTEIVLINEEESLNPVEKAVYDFQGLKILIAEDDDNNYLFLAKALSLHKIDVIHAGNGIEAVEICRTVPGIKLVLMDIKMPKMDGHEATRQIKAMFPFLPVIAQTAYAMKSDELDSYKAGCNDYIAKPINVNLLLGKIYTLTT